MKLSNAKMEVLHVKKCWKLLTLCLVLTTAFLAGCSKQESMGRPETSLEESQPDLVKSEETQNQEPEKGTAFETDETLENDVAYKTYYLQTSVQNAPVPGLALYEDGRFSFSFDILSSYLNCGTYQVEDGILTAVTDDGLYHFAFKEEDGRYLFVEGESSDVTLIDPRVGIEVTDGAVFARNEQRMNAIVKEIGEDYFVVSSRTDEMPGVYEVYFGETDKSGLKGGDEIEIIWDRPLAEGNRIYAKSITPVPAQSNRSDGSSS